MGPDLGLVRNLLTPLWSLRVAGPQPSPDYMKILIAENAVLQQLSETPTQGNEKAGLLHRK